MSVRLFSSLRTRLLAAQMVVVLVGVVTLLALAQVRVLEALLVAALAASVAGLVTSLLLTRQILRPLNEIVRTSQRIARGHYDERVALPASEELARVASNFNQMAESLEQIEQQRVALIGNVSHELRTPLSALEGYLEGLIDGLFTSDPATFAEMGQEVRRLSRLVDDLQELSRVEAGQIPLQLDTFDLIPLVASVVTQLRPQATDQCLELLSEWGQEPLVVRADPDRTRQVLFNLIGNAIRYTPADGCIRVQLRAQPGVAEIAVVDDGPGIPAEALPYLFERFYRVDRSRSRASGGSGIGLTIARHLAWAMGGDLTAESAGPGQGSTFRFTLPLAPPH